MGDVVETGINWSLLESRLFCGTLRCTSCAASFAAVIQAPDWAADPPSVTCACGAPMLRVDPEVEPDAEEFLRVLPKHQAHLAD